MRAAFFVLVWLLLPLPAGAKDFSVEVRSERSFGYFVGDLVRSLVEIRGPADAELERASLPHPVPLRGSLDLRDVSVQELEDGQQHLWRIRLTYQNFYAALDVRDIEIPAFQVSFRIGGEHELVDAPAWRFGVAPLREVTPEQKERGADYMRPDPGGDFVDDAWFLQIGILFAALSVTLLIAIAWDRGWPPFHRRPTRVFALSARKLAALVRQPESAATLRSAVRDLHRAFDATDGKSLLRPDLNEFFRRRPEFASLRATTERFFEASEAMFFGVEQNQRSSGFTVAELAGFAKALAERERAR